MRILTTRSEKNLTELARRLYKIEGPAAPAAERKAVDALLRSNPHLRAAGSLAPGAPIVVPEVDGLEAATDTGVGFDFGPGGAKDLGAALRRLSEVLGAARAEAQQEEDAATRDLKQYARELGALDPEVKDRVTAAQLASKARTKEHAELRKSDQQALARLGRDLETLMKALG